MKAAPCLLGESKHEMYSGEVGDGLDVLSAY